VIEVGPIGKISCNTKIWLEHNKRPLLGKGRYVLLKNIRRTSSLKKSAEMLGVSYKTAQNYIKKIEANLNEKIIKTTKGGPNAGGSTVLNKTGIMLIQKYEKALSRQS
jgi:molybdate transport system regulatory protein